jgi:hypothetical protein
MIKILYSLRRCNIGLFVYKYPQLLGIRHSSCPCIACRVVCVGVNC